MMQVWLRRDPKPWQASRESRADAADQAMAATQTAYKARLDAQLQDEDAAVTVKFAVTLLIRP